MSDIMPRHFYRTRVIAMHPGILRLAQFIGVRTRLTVVAVCVTRYVPFRVWGTYLLTAARDTLRVLRGTRSE